MRGALLALLATFCGTGWAIPASAQQTAPSAAARDSVAQVLDSARGKSAGHVLPSVDRFSWGDLTIPAGATVDGPVAAAHGTVNVRGLVNGDVFAVGGDVVVHSGGEVTGSALALQGKVIVDGGRVRGDMNAVAPAPAAAPEVAKRTGTAAVWHALQVTGGWLVVVLLIGLAVILFSGAQLEAVVQALENRFTASLVVGIAAQVGVIPLLGLLCLALVLTIVGILLIPFAIVAYILGVAGLVALGVLAATSVAGHALVRQGPNVRERAVRSMVVGTLLLTLPWIACALLVNSPWGELVARIVAVAVTWVAASAGLGASLLARGGVQRIHVHTARVDVSPEGWQTPTPIGGVIAARRPTATPSTPTGAGN